MKKRMLKAAAFLLVTGGLLTALYPSIRNFGNGFTQSKAIHDYQEAVDAMTSADREKAWAQAAAYNQKLKEQGQSWTLSKKEAGEYEAQLSITGQGIMGYIHMPRIDCTLPICHGTEENVLRWAAGHIEGSSLPVGGKGSHSVISGHRGLPSARLFTDLDQVEIGDTFTIYVLDKTLTYQVNEIKTVLPKETESLKIRPDEDLCTIVTCTPYGINSHRLLVTGRRIETPNQPVETDPLKQWIYRLTVMAVLLLAAAFCTVLLHRRKNKERNKSNE